MRIKSLLGTLLAVTLGMMAMPASAQVVVIISTKNPISKLTPDQVSQIFLGQAKTFYSGGMAVPLDQAEGADRHAFYLKVTGKSPAQIKAYWSKQTFSGNAQPPQVLPDSKAVVKLVGENPKYIGYVDKGAVDASVKVVLTL
jgi:ABC-type phosphate transport system substrate-binding protein